jgi:hypothetical protein
LVVIVVVIIAQVVGHDYQWVEKSVSWVCEFAVWGSALGKYGFRGSALRAFGA